MLYLNVRDFSIVIHLENIDCTSAYPKVKTNDNGMDLLTIKSHSITSWLLTDFSTEP